MLDSLSAPAQGAAVATSASRTTVAVIFGGHSGEHTISCATASAVLRAIDRSRFDVLPIGITHEGTWMLMRDEPEMLALRAEGDPVTVSSSGLALGTISVPLGPGEWTVTYPDGSTQALPPIDVLFPLLHGPYGEDGTIQGLAEMLGMRYVGCGVSASAAGMDKQITKVLLNAAGIATAPHVVVYPSQWRDHRETVLAACENLTYPLFVKPARAGSSLGISKVDEPSALVAAIEAAREVDPKVLVESGIVGREIEVAVLQGREGEPARVAEPGEVRMDQEQGAGEFYDYETKYLAHDAVAMVCPVPLAPGLREVLQSTAARAFEAIGGEGLTRVDFFVTEAGAVIVNEVNTMPGFTPFSMYPFLWQHSGMSYTELVTELIELALSRPADVNR